MKVSCSEIMLKLSCLRKWDYAGETRRNLIPIGSGAPALVLGTHVHSALQHFYRSNIDPRETFKSEFAAQLMGWDSEGLDYDQEKFSKLYQLGVTMLTGYLDHYGQDPQHDIDGIRVKVTEQEFMVPIPGTEDGYLVGKMDGLCVDRDGAVWVLEHKTFSQPPKMLLLHFQMLAYTWAANQLAQAGNEQFVAMGIAPGTRVWGALYNGLRKQAPGPRVTAPLFMREWIRRTTRELEIFGHTLTSVYTEMSRPDIAIYPTITRECEYCAYQSPCLAAQMGADEDWLLSSGYKVRPPRGAVYEDTEGLES